MRGLVGEHRPERAGTADSPGREHGDRDVVEHVREQRQQGEVAANVPAGLGPLGDDEVTARLLGGERFGG